MASCFFTPGYWKITKDFQVYVFHDKEKENENGTVQLMKHCFIRFQENTSEPLKRKIYLRM